MLTRRSLVASASAAFSLSAAAPALAALKVEAIGMPEKTRLLQRAREELERLGAAIVHHDRVAIADYASPSRVARFHLLDMASGDVASLLVSHGRGSDPANSGWLKDFSNVVGSNASSEGAYRTGDQYSGKHGRSMRLIGLDPGNSNAEARAIVVHSASYVSRDMATRLGRVGRSEGCFAFSTADLPRVLNRLGPGRLLLSTRI
ncbi:MAG: murein L,D-transpeptidase catalytic domain family protein [Caulobacter sp.]|nr:murein L,D-transpeptidase catalytic domain family protein [Caulobacter sp.]